MTALVGGIDNQTDSVKAHVTAGLASFKQSLSGLSSFLMNPKELEGGGVFRHMMQKQLNEPIIKSHEPSA